MWRSRVARAAALLAALIAIGIATPAAAQFLFGWGRPSAPVPQNRGLNPFDNFLEPRPVQRPADFSRAPPPKKSETVPEKTILVLGDSMADWLASGLEDAFAETPEIGVVRKHRTVSGLIRYQPKGAPADWPAAAREILAAENPSFIVIMLGLNDRMDIREPVAEKPDAKTSEKTADKPSDGRQDSAKKKKQDGEAPREGASDWGGIPQPDDEGGGEEQPASIVAQERGGGAGGVHEFRGEKWIELYGRKIAEMIAAAKSKGVPVLWVGLPPLRGARSSADMLFLDALYRDHASRAGITYVDVWDGFVDEAGRFLNQGPDFEGQIRRLRTPDGVYFTKAGARKLAHFAEREIRRLLATRISPVALPSEPATPDGTARPGGPAPRPIAGPIVPLVASTVGADELLGGMGSRPAGVDALAARTLVKGEPLMPPAGRADDFVWPRRNVGAEIAPATVSLPESEPARVPPQPPARAETSAGAKAGVRGVPGAILGPPPGPQLAPFPGQASPPPRARGNNPPRPPAPVGPSALAPGLFSR